jgi:hypothetical protein
LTLLTAKDGERLVDLRVPYGVDTEGDVVNTGFAIVRVWWEDSGFGEMEVKGRLEGWGMADHLLEE